jgi:ABC-type transport system involved in multi-copper enzyme maturation permease subunit
VLAVYLITLRQLTGRWRLLIMAALAGMPVAITTLMLRSNDAPSVNDFETVVLSAMLSGSIAPLVVLAIGGAAFANEVEDRTLANITLSPLPRWKIVWAKLLGVFTVAGPFIAVSAFLTGYIGFIGDPKATAAITASALAGLALYGAFFTWLGIRTTYAIGVGLLYIMLWEGFIAGFVSGARVLSIRHYAVAWMHTLDERRFAALTHPSVTSVIATTVIAFAAFVFLSVRRLRRMDIP